MQLNSADLQVLSAGLRENKGFHILTRWYFGWEPLPYQYLFHHIPIKNTTFLAGIGSGKTSSVAASILADCLTLPGFKGLNASVTAVQSQLTFEMIDSWREQSSNLNNLITDMTLRPYPIITFWNTSTFEFRTAGLGAKFIRGHEYDRINYDEAGLDEDGSAIKVLRGRLRGIRSDGRPRMARLDVTGTPSASVWFRDRFEIGLKGHPRYTEETAKYYRSLRVTTFDNTRLTPEQIALIVAEYPPEMADIELRAEFPDWGLSTFPHGHIQACIDRTMNDEMEIAIRPEDGMIKAGWENEEWPRVGAVLWKKPYRPGRLYVMAGDPGVDTPPRRNSPCVMVFDVTTMPAELVYFHWPSGRGSYDPFMNSYKRAIEEYHPLAKGIDATGTQKGLNDLGFEKYGIKLDGLHFGSIKEELINSLLVAISSHDFRFPMIQGLVNQLQTYRREEDKDSDQDIVMTLGQIAYLMRQFRTSPVNIGKPKKKNNFYNPRLRIRASYRR